jgi:NADPH2:quinone reductase
MGRTLMRAALVEQLEGPASVVVREVEEPPADPTKVRIDVAAAGISWPDTLMTRGMYQTKPDLPFAPGAEVAGVVRTAPSDSGFAPGQRVAAFPRVGGFCSVLDVEPALVLPLPDEVSFEAGCAIPMNYLTMHFGLRRRGALQAGETVLVHGAAGGIGTAALQLCRGFGARTIAVVSNSEKVDVAREAGADEVVLADGFKDAALELTAGRGVDMVVDPVGGDRFTDSLRSLAPLGRLLVIGFTGGEVPTVKVNRLLLRNISVIGVGWGAYFDTHPELAHEQWPEMVPLMRDGTIAPLISERYALQDVTTALIAMEQRRTLGKAVLLF